MVRLASPAEHFAHIGGYRGVEKYEELVADKRLVGTSSWWNQMDRDKDLGEVRPDQFIITSAKTGPQGTTFDVLVANSDDARAQSLKKARNHIGH